MPVNILAPNPNLVCAGNCRGQNVQVDSTTIDSSTAIIALNVPYTMVTGGGMPTRPTKGPQPQSNAWTFPAGTNLVLSRAEAAVLVAMGAATFPAQM